MAPCQRCGVGNRSGRGQGWCSNPQCRQAEQEERLAQQSAEKRARQQERAAQGAGSRGPVSITMSTRGKKRELQAKTVEEGVGSRGPMPGSGGRPEEAESERTQRRELQAERAKEGLGSRGPMPGSGGRPEEEESERTQRRELQAERAKEGVGSRGPKPEEESHRTHRRELQAERAEEGVGSRGPKPEEDSYRTHRRELQAERAEEGVGSRGPMPGSGGRPEEEESERTQRRELQAERAEEGVGSRGPMPGSGGRPEEEESERTQRRELQAERAKDGVSSRGPKPEQESYRTHRRELQAERAEEGVGSRGPKPEEDSYRTHRRELQAERAEEGMGSRGPKPVATELQQQGYPFPDEDVLSPERAQADYRAFTRSWGRFGLSRICEECRIFTTGKYCRPAKSTGKMLCKNCREKTAKILLPILPPIPEALQHLQPIEQHLIAMARISQVLLDKLPSGGPSAQWGRMYAVLVDDPFICDVLEGATLEEDGTVLVEGVQGKTASPARLDCLHKALQELKTQHRLYQANPAVDRALTRMESILAGKAQPCTSAAAMTAHETSQERQTGESGGSHSSALGGEAQHSEDAAASVETMEEKEDKLQMTYLIPKELKTPRAETVELQKARGTAELTDDMDVKFFPHLFSTGTGGWQNGYGSFSQYARKRLLGSDPRFESSPAYIMWLLEMHLKKRLSGNINVRIGNQQAPGGKTKYQEGKGQVFTALRDIPGTSSYVY
ncbi:pfh1, partial [Symbiodinium natans]